MKFTSNAASGPQEPLSSAVPEHKFLLYCADGEKFMLKLEGDNLVCEFDTLAKAVVHARKLRPKAALTVYNALGQVMLDTAV